MSYAWMESQWDCLILCRLKFSDTRAQTHSRVLEQTHTLARSLALSLSLSLSL